jgi:hypothetical protein
VVAPKKQRDYVHPDARLKKLKTWTEEVLAEQGNQKWGSLFYFTAADPTEEGHDQQPRRGVAAVMRRLAGDEHPV